MFRDFDSIQIGEVQTIVKVITKDDVRRFVEMTGDDNPLHVSRAYAETTSFKDIVVHGMLGASFISTVIGTKLPGTGALWISQNMEFLLPVRLGDELSIHCRVLKKHDRERILELETWICNQHQKVVLTGQGKVKVLVPPVLQAETEPEPRLKVAVVTGGAGGIGKAICLRMASEGYHVVVNYHGNSELATQIVDEIHRGESRAIAVQADISSEEGARKLYLAACEEFGGVSVLVNNASPRINPKTYASMEWSDVQKQIDVQVKGAFLMSKLCAPEMCKRRWGRIVNITSQAIDGPPTVTWSAYATAKGALAVFSRYLAAELGPQGVTVNCVSPGMCETALVGDVPEKAQMIIARQTPLRRLAKPEDVAAAVAFLVSEGASFVTGDTLAVNGGMTMQ